MIRLRNELTRWTCVTLLAAGCGNPTNSGSDAATRDVNTDVDSGHGDGSSPTDSAVDGAMDDTAARDSAVNGDSARDSTVTTDVTSDASVGPIVISSPLMLDATNVLPGTTLHGTVTYQNVGTSPVMVLDVVITGRPPGATHSGGPFADLAPRNGAATLAPGQMLTLNASRTFTTTDPSGTWESYPTYQDSAGVWHDGPSLYFTVTGTTPGTDAGTDTGVGTDAGGATGPTPLDLDPTGTTIPDTNYAIPAGAIFMSPTGVDTASGTMSQPVRSLARALSLAPSGGTVVVRGGLYRDGAASTSRTVTLQAYPHEQAWFDGTDVIPASAWTSDGAGHWTMPWSTPSFCAGGYYNFPYDAQPTTNNGPCTHYDMYGDPGYPAAGDPQLLFVDGTYVHETNALSGVSATSFYYDWSHRVMYIGIDPSGHTIEMASRAQAIVLSGDNEQILGLGFRRYATNEYDNVTSGAVYISGAGGTVQDAMFTQMAGRALYLGSVGSHLTHSSFANNGFNGMGSNGHQHTTGAPDGIDIEACLFHGNNAEHYGTGCSASCAQAGVKMAHMDGFTLRNNVFENNVNAQGFWCDLACSQGVMVNNIARNNGLAGIMYEVSDTGIIASNVTFGNGTYGIRVAAANTKIWNNSVFDNAQAAVWIYDDPRSPGVGGWTDVGPDTSHCQFVNNIVSSPTEPIRLQGTLPSPNTTPDQFFDTYDYNAWNRPAGTSHILVNWMTITGHIYYYSVASFTAATTWDAHSLDLASATDPFFVDQAGGNYNVRSTSAAYDNGTPLPADIAGAIGVAPGGVVSRGAIRWPGNP